MEKFILFFLIFEDAGKEKRRKDKGWGFYIIKGLIYFWNQLQI